MKTTTKKKAAAVTVKASPGIIKSITPADFILRAADRLAQAVRRNYENNTAAILATGNDDLVEAMDDYRCDRDDVIGLPEIDLSVIEEKEK